MGDIYAETEALIDALGDLNAHGSALAAAALTLAGDADDPPMTATGQQASRSPIVNAWRATVAELVERGRLRASNDDEGEAGDWRSAATGAGATPIRNTA